MGFFGNTLDRFFSLFGYFRANDASRQALADTRAMTYAVNRAMYDNTIYLPRRAGGAREQILDMYFNEVATAKVAATCLVGHFNPVKEIVDAYQNVQPGTWGQGMKAADTVDGDPESKAINPALADPLRQLWRNSNFDSAKELMQRWAANYGTVGLRPRMSKSGRIALQVDDPARLFDVEEDDDGNVTSVVLKYLIPHNDGTPVQPAPRMVPVVEIINRDEFSQTIDGVEQIADDRRKNRYGFCPYVLLRHRDNGTIYGDWAYKGAESVIHAINYRISRQDRSIDRHQFPNWFATAGGKLDQQKIHMGESQLTYVQTVPGAPPPSLEPLVPKIDQKAAQDFWTDLRDMMASRAPVLTINNLKLLSGISGESLQQVLKPAESDILSVRPAYDHALIRAMQMGISIGAEEGRWNVGNGMGQGAGERAFKSGLEDFVFDSRPALPQTTAQQLAQQQLEALKKQNAEPSPVLPARMRPPAGGAISAGANGAGAAAGASASKNGNGDSSFISTVRKIASEAGVR